MLQLVRFVFLVFLVSLALLNSSCTNPFNDSIDTVATPIPGVVRSLNVSHKYYRQKVENKTQAFYQSNDYTKHWLDKKGAHPRFKAFISEVKESYRYGMNPEEYNLGEIEASVDKLYKNRKRTEGEMSELDIRITASFFLFTTHLLEGRIRNPGAKDFIWKRGMAHEDDVALLLKNDSKKELRDELDDLQPKDPQYKSLQKALAEYRQLEMTGKFKQIPENIRIKPGDTNVNVVLIKRRLLLTDMSDKRSGDSSVYDSTMLTAIKKFEKRHGLKSDGLVDKELVRYLNIPFSNLADVIALNLERLRWHPHLPAKDEYILVNAPEYMLRIQDGKKVKLEMRVVLGSEFNATPIFADTLKYIVFSPTWNVPKSILEEEFLPKLKADAAHYSSEFTFFKGGEEIDPTEEDWNDEKLNIAAYQAVQRPGPANSLGSVKFIMPNNFSIYLHDTPADRLFNKQDRAFSHGCVRLEKPLELAEYLLRDQRKWNKKEIAAAMQLEEPKHVNLKRNYPVHIVYRTAWVDNDGLVNFRKDVYGHDERQLAQLRKPQPLLSYNEGN